jgi:hypothetical protein
MTVLNTWRPMSMGSVADRTPKGARSTVFSSIMNVRSPDGSFLWHAGYRKNHPLKLFMRLFRSAVCGIFKGLVRIIRPPRFSYGLYGKTKDSIWIVTSERGYATKDGGYKTIYGDTDDDDTLLVIGPAAQCGAREKSLSRYSRRKPGGLEAY